MAVQDVIAISLEAGLIHFDGHGDVSAEGDDGRKARRVACLTYHFAAAREEDPESLEAWVAVDLCQCGKVSRGLDYLSDKLIRFSGNEVGVHDATKYGARASSSVIVFSRTINADPSGQYSECKTSDCELGREGARAGFEVFIRVSVPRFILLERIVGRSLADAALRPGDVRDANEEPGMSRR